MRKPRHRLQWPLPRGGPQLAVLGAVLCLGAPAPGSAESADGTLPPAVARSIVGDPVRSRPRPPEWLGENVYFKKGSGFEYRQEVVLGDHPVQLGFQGPVVRKKKSLGLTVEVRF